MVKMQIEESAKQIYNNSIVIDGLNVSNWHSPRVFQSLHAGGLTAINATVAVWENYRETVDNITAWLHRFRNYAGILSQVKTVQDIHQAKQQGKVGVILGWQNASPLENHLDRLILFHALGVRIIQLTYSERNLLGNGCNERSDDGLSHFGLDAIRQMNELGILIDLSHCGDRTTLQAIEASEKPVACTHANARAFFNATRNKTDESLKLIAEKGGVVGAVAFPTFLRKGFESTIADYVDAIDDLVARVGIDHVAIGTDYIQDHPNTFLDWTSSQQGTKPRKRKEPLPDPLLHPRGMETPDRLPNLAVELLRRGYHEIEIAKILGGNWVRLFQEVWQG
jgi:membrane dipeptidase